MSKSERTRAALLLVVVFVVGAVMGAAVDRLLLFREGRMYPKHGLRAASHRMLNRLDRDLNLNPQQEEQVRQILTRRAARLDAVWKNAEPAMLAEIERGDAEISAVLTGEQKTKFEEMKRRWRNRARRALGKPGPPR